LYNPRGSSPNTSNALNSGQPEQALGRSRGGFGTKVHVSVNPLGQPVELTVTAG
jgi:hypothetical protein